MDLEERLTELETKLAFDDDTVDQLSDTIARQQLEINELREAVKLLHQQLKSLHEVPGAPMGDEPPPPHY